VGSVSLTASSLSVSSVTLSPVQQKYLISYLNGGFQKAVGYQITAGSGFNLPGVNVGSAFLYSTATDFYLYN